MSLKLYFHPLSSSCWKALIALYESGTPFDRRVVDLSDPSDRAMLTALWPMARLPVLRDESRGETIPDAGIIIEYLAAHHPGRITLLPADSEFARRVRHWDRFFDVYVHEPMQKIVHDRARPAGSRDQIGVRDARALIMAAYEVVDRHMADRVWATGATFTMADCAAAPALHYAGMVAPIPTGLVHLGAYVDRLTTRPSFVRVLEEAAPYRSLFPLEERAS